MTTKIPEILPMMNWQWVYILEVSRQFGENTNLETEKFSRTPHVLKMAVSQKQQFLEHAVFQKTLRVPKSCSAQNVEILPKYQTGPEERYQRLLWPTQNPGKGITNSKINNNNNANETFRNSGTLPQPKRFLYQRPYRIEVARLFGKIWRPGALDVGFDLFPI